MPVISFDYTVFPVVQEGKLIPVYIPRISINLGINHKIFPTDIKCILDSGSDFNLFPANIGESLGLVITEGKLREHTGIGGNVVKAYDHQLKLFIEGYSFTTPIHFSYEHKIPLLGRQGFFKFFNKVTFNEKSLRVELDY